MTAVHYKQDVR